MPTLTTDDGVKIYYEEAGTGAPVVFVHEFAGDLRSWELQLQHFSRLYRCIAYNARPTISAQCWTGSGSKKRTSSAFQWARSRRCTSASAIRIERSR